MRSLWLCFLVFAPTGGSRAEDAVGVKQTIEYVQRLQTNTGGFLTIEPQPNIRLAPNLRATSAAVRTLHYLGGKVPQPDLCAKFVASCFDSESGGFSDFPGGKPEVFATAVGIMAVTALKMPRDKFEAGAVRYLTENAKSFDDIRIAAAALEPLATKSPKTAAWLGDVKKLRNMDGTFGKGLGQARETGSAVVALLRLGGEVEGQKGAILMALKEGQRESGGFGRADSDLDSDLETSYRVMRCFMMLKVRPTRVEGLRTFVAKCRNGDGGYGLSPGQPSSVNGTYYAAIISHWLDQK